MENSCESIEVCDDILAVLNDAKVALIKRDSKKLAEISNHTIHCIGIYQSQRALMVAITIYALSKIFDQESLFKKHEIHEKEFIDKLLEKLDDSIKFIKEKNFGGFDETIKKIITTISEFDDSFSKYLQQVIEFARVQKGANIYEHGISLSSVAKMVGVSKWDLMRKVSETRVHESPEKRERELSPKEKLIKAKKILGYG